MAEPTTEKLARALESIQAVPREMVQRAREREQRALEAGSGDDDEDLDGYDEDDPY